MADTGITVTVNRVLDNNKMFGNNFCDLQSICEIQDDKDPPYSTFEPKGVQVYEYH